jgi:chromosomal replication initiation ATPase DnaA
LSAADTAARRARLWSPEGGIQSSELDIVSPAEFRRRLMTKRREESQAERQRKIDAAVASAVKFAADWRANNAFASMRPGQQCQEITRACCTHFGLRRVDIMARRRTANITYPRHIAMYLMTEFTASSFPAIGRHFGGLDHTTVLHGWRKMKTRLPLEEKLQADVAAIRQAVGIGGDNAD